MMSLSIYDHINSLYELRKLHLFSLAKNASCSVNDPDSDFTNGDQWELDTPYCADENGRMESEIWESERPKPRSCE